MCGIAVAIDWDEAEVAVARMIGAMTHRGDVTDPLVSPGPRTAMCTRRLRIVDAERAVQPQFSFDNRIVVALNGQIYNHAALRRELEGFGATFCTESDTEVLATALRVWGGAALQRLVGMYAFVALDLKTGEFLAARDPLGVKPLYLIQNGSGFLFSSEMRPLLEASATGDVLLLPPGHVLSQKLFAPFATLAPDPEVAPAVDDPGTLDRLMEEAVRIRLPPELPFATFFSGGIDSTLIAHYAGRHRPQAPGYFLGGYDAPDYAYAARYADRTGYDLRMVAFDPEATTHLIEAVVATAETFEPGVIRDALCTYLLARHVHADGYRVALCGEGADELFAGYAPLEIAYAEGPEFGAPVRDQLLASMHRGNLQRMDRCGMRFALELREPFLDPSIVGYALNLAPSALVREVNGEARGKQPLRNLYDLHPELPVELRDRAKLPLHRGAGFDVSQQDAPWVRFAEAAIDDCTFADGQREFADYDLRSKEELLYLRALAGALDIARLPHLKGRMRLAFPAVKRMDRVAEYLV